MSQNLLGLVTVNRFSGPKPKLEVITVNRFSGPKPKLEVQSL